MKFQFIRSPVLAMALFFSVSVGAVSVVPEKKPTTLSFVKFVSLPPIADFALGSSVLSPTAQEQLGMVLSRFNTLSVESIVVTGFANTVIPEQRESLSLERAHSIKAFFILHGVNPKNITIQVGDSNIVGAGRTGQVFFEVVGDSDN